VRVANSILVPLIVACALFMENLDGTVISMALPQMAESFETSPIHLSLAFTAYLLSLAVFIPISGWFADRFGARTVFRTAITVFTIGSVLCGFSDSVATLTMARIVQGVGGAMMTPVGRLVLLRSVEKSELVRAMAWLTVPAQLGPVLGPPLGGFIVTYYSWPWIFFLNVPIGIIGLVLASIFIENYKEPETAPLDIRGFIFSGTALAGLMLGFELVGRDAAGMLTGIFLLGIGAGAAMLYLAHASRHRNPVIDLSLFRIPTFAITVAAGSLFRIGVGALPFLLPLMLQIGFGMDALTAGLLTVASALGSLLMKFTAQPVLRRFGFRRVLFVNGMISALFFFSYAAFRPSMPELLIFVLLLCGGFFRSLQFTGLNILPYADIPRSHMSRATSLASTVQQLSLSIGVATGAMLLHITLTWRGSEDLGPDDFWLGFTLLGLFSIISALIFLRLPPGSGDEISGTPRLAKPIPPAADKQ
jgi:EmrB/QacA subfamily drug resistance transporter